MGTRISDTALVFEGGGMRAALTSAFAVTLLEQGIDFDWVAGISAGASNAANYVSRDAKRTRRSFVDFPADERFGGWRSFSRGQGYFNARYIYRETCEPGMALPFHWRDFQDNPADMLCVGFDVRTGAEVVWSKADYARMDDLMARVQASSTMPVIMPPVDIDGRLYVDGAMGADGGIPLTLAQEAGFERFVIVLTQQRDYVKEPVGMRSFLRAHFRSYPRLVEAMFTRHERYNATRERIFELERQGRAHIFAPEVMPLKNSTRDLSRLAAAHRLGLSQARRELPALREFLGLARP
ncbi:patatin family protein [Brevibacterium sp. 91QC2O2]|jgi:predicted patatin/cPLA2 family phospholipase|uniref:patatin-like phospholipase family protein n=1 Tax=Brevibacterium sp. 91QC2O2 TaxID=2968458 RepID=UPI00211BC196|nr:patatin family protein [Brevibacterium sp. 91QC2O2]MCQ9368392.1 patatin family protein [Brevibacterium sp. 91QC2O2]